MTLLAAVGVGTTLLMFFVQTLVTNIGFMRELVTNPALPLSEKVDVLMLFALAPTTTMTPVQVLLASLLATLAGINMALVSQVYLMRTTCHAGIGGGAGMLGGILGAGCSSCGAVVLSVFLPFTAALGIVALLPLKGMEFTLAAIVLLVVTAWRTGARIRGQPRARRNA